MRVIFLFLILFLPSCQPKKEDNRYGIKSQAGASVKRTPPLPTTPTVDASKNACIICLDSGHGGYDPGTRRRKPPYLCEKHLSLDLSLSIEKQLVQYGYKVVLTRRSDQFIALPDRVVIAERNNARLFVAIHFNWAKNTVCRGIEVFFFDKKGDLRSTLSKRAASSIMKNIVISTSFPSRGIKHGNFCVLRETCMPAVLVEAGFFSNQQDVRLLKQKNVRLLLSKAIAKGIHEFCLMNR